MKILFVEEGKPNNSGGFGGSLYSMLETIKLLSDKEDIEFHIFTYFEVPQIYSLIDINKINYSFRIEFKKLKKPQSNKSMTSKKNKFLPQWLRTDLTCFLELKNRYAFYRKNITKIKPDIVWGNNMITGNFASLIAAKSKFIPYIQHQRAQLESFGIVPFLSLLLSRKNICISSYIKKTIFKNSIVTLLFKTKVATVHNFYLNLRENKTFVKNELKFIQILFLGRIIPQKGIEQFVDLVERLHLVSSKLPILFQVYGEFETNTYKNEVYDYIKGKGLEKVIRLNPFSQKEKIFRKDSINILIHTTLQRQPEPFGRVLIDANYYGAIPFSNGFGGASEAIINDKNGIIFSSLDDLSSKITPIIGDFNLYYSLLNKYYKFAQINFSGEKQKEVLFKTLS